MSLLLRLPGLRGAIRQAVADAVAKSGTASPSRWLVDFVRGGGENASGEVVNVATAQNVAAFTAALTAISEDIAKVPLILYRPAAGGRGSERAENHPLYRLLHDRPNRRQTSFEWREQMCQRLMLAGNAFHHIGRDRAGLVRAIVPIRNDLVTIKVATDGSDELFYEVRGAVAGAKAVTYPESEILHVRGRADSQGDGLVGQSILSAAREALGLSLATQKHGSRLFKNGARPGGVLVSPQALSPTAQQNLQKSWDANASGENAHRTAVLEGGVTYQQLGLSAEDSQFLETRKYQWAEIAAFFRIAPHKVGNLEKATYTNIEQQSSEYVTDTLMPWGGRIEGRLKVALLTPDEIDQGYHFKFLWDGLLRGDTKSRMEAYALAIQNLILSPNEARERESLIPYEGGDDFKNPAITPKATGGDPDQSQDQGGQA